MKRTLTYAFAITLGASACSPSLRVVDSTSTDRSSKKDYLGYFLPKTLLKIRVPIEQAVFSPGLMSKAPAADRLTLMKHLYVAYGWEALKTDEDKFGIGEKIQFIPQTLPDSKKYFTIQYGNGKALANSMGLVLNRDGMISSGEFAQENKTFEYATKAFELIAHTASIFMGLGNKNTDEKPGLFAKAPTDQHTLRILALMDELASITAAKADLIKNMTNAVASNDPLKYRTELIDKRIIQIKEEILGKYKKTVYNLSLLYEPSKDKEKVDLLKLDPASGVAIPQINVKDPALTSLAGFLSKDKAGKPLTITIEPAYDLPAPANEFKTTSSFQGNHFLVYNVPAKFRITLTYDGKPLKSYSSEEDEKGTDVYEIFFPQRGKMAALPVDFKEMKVVFLEDIGAIKEVKSSKATELNATNVGLAVTALDSVLTLRNKIKESKKEKPAEEAKEEVKEQVIRLIIENPAPAQPPQLETPPANGQ